MAPVSAVTNAQIPDIIREVKSRLAGHPLAPDLWAATYVLLGMISFFTTGEAEVRAWTIAASTPAAQAAGAIHSDLERGFIRAEVIRWDELLKAGSEANAKKLGIMRTEGKTYPVQDGDCLHVLFNV